MEQHIYTFSELENILNSYESSDKEKSSQALKDANNLVFDFVDDKCDIDKSSPEAIQKFIDLIKTVGTLPNKTIMLDVYTRALAKIESFVSKTNEILDNIIGNRVYSLTSDENQIKFNMVTFFVYQDMNLVDKNLDINNITPQQVIDVIYSINLTDKQHEEYTDKFVERIIIDDDLFNLIPPKILTDAYIYIRRGLLKNKNDKNLLKKYEKIKKRIDNLIGNFAKQVDYFCSDPFNIADVYDGYRKMCKIREKDLNIEKSDNESTKKYKQEVSGNIKNTLQRLEEIVSDYKEMFNIKDLKSDDAEKLNERWKEIKDLLKDIDVNDDILSVLSKYQFLDENDQPLPQFVDDEGVEHLDFKTGYKLKSDGRLAHIISLAKNNVNMVNIGDLDKDVKDLDLSSQLNDVLRRKVAYVSVVDQAIQNAQNLPHDHLSDEEVDEVWNEITTSGGKISDIGYQSALNNEVNEIAGFAGLLANEIGNDKDVVFKPFQAVEDVDKLAKTRTEKSGAQGRKQKVNFFKRVCKTFGVASAFSTGLTFIGKATGVAWFGAAIGTTIGIGNMTYQGFKWRKEQKKNGKPYDLKTYFKDKRNWGPAVASGLGIAAVINMATGNPELATGFGLTAMVVGGGSAAAMTYKDIMAAGYTRGQALAGSLGIVGATVAGGVLGRFAMDNLVNYVNNHTDSNLFKQETTIVKGEEHTERVYNKGVIDHHKDMMLKNHWETPQSYDTRINNLMNAGLSHDDAVRYLLAWHDATDHNLGPRYFNNIGLNSDALADFRASIDGTEVNITPEAINAFDKFNPHISELNQVGHIDGAPILHNLPANATYDANGIAVTGKDFYTTFANGASAFQDIVVPADIETVFTPNELSWPAGIGTFGIYEPRVIPEEYTQILKERAGALADRLNKNITLLPNDENIDDKHQEVDDYKGEEDSRNNNSDHAEVDDKGGEDGHDCILENPKLYGFFRTCKDIMYKTMRAGKNGVKRTIKGLHQINEQIIQNVGESANRIQQGVLKMKKEREILENEHQMIVLSGEEARELKKLEEEIKREKIKLLGELEIADIKQKHEIKLRLRGYDALIVSVKKYKEFGGKDGIEAAIALQELENKLKRLRTKGDNDVTLDNVKTETKIKEIKAKSKNKLFRLAGSRIVGFFKGMKDVNNDDIITEKNATKIIEEKLKQSKTNFEKSIWNEASVKLQRLIDEHKYTGKDINNLINSLIREAQKQIEE